MPFSSNAFNGLLFEHIILINPEICLDIGAGAGKNGKIVREAKSDCILDGIEPTESYIEKYDLKSIYNNIYKLDIESYLRSHSSNRYDLVILGDVLEHLFRSEVIDYLDCLLYRSKWVICIWPENYPQDEEFDNKYEIHKSNFSLKDFCNNFEVVFFLKTFEAYLYNNPVFREITLNYCVLKGYTQEKHNSLYKFSSQ